MLRASVSKRKRGALGGGEILHGPGEAVHAAGDAPDAAGLGAPDQGEERRGGVGRAADVGGVAAEELAEPGVAELGFERSGQRARRGHVGDQRGVAEDGAADHQRVGIGRPHHRGVEGGVEPAGAVVEGAEVGGGAGAGEVADGGLAGGGVGVEVEGAAVGPPVAGEDGLGDQGEVVGEGGADVGEKVVEDGAQGKHGRAGVDGTGDARDCAQLASGGAEAVDDGDVEAGMGEAERRRQAADAGADDHRFLPASASHAVLLPRTRDC